MAGINKVIIVGNLGNDPEIRTMPNGEQIANISVATSESWTDKNTDRYTTEIQGDNLQMLGGRQDESKQAKPSKAKPEPLSAMAEQDDFSDGIPF